MGRRINISCESCSQTLAVDPASMGKQVRCPKCQALSVIPATSRVAAKTVTQPDGKSHAAGRVPGGKKPASKPPANSRPTRASSSETTLVGCPDCGKRMSVQLLDRPALIKCPSCLVKIRLPAWSQPPGTIASVVDRSPETVESGSPAGQSVPATPNPKKPAPKAPARERTSTPRSSTQRSSSTPTADATPQPSSVLDLGSLNVPMPPTPIAPASSNSGGFTAGTPGTQRSTGNTKTRVLDWINNHRWITAIGGMNLLGVLAAIVYSDIWMLLTVQVPVGALIIGLLFVPRKHLVDRMMTSAVTRFAGLGVGGVLITILLIAARSILKTAKRNDGDFSFLTDLSGIGSMLISLAVFAACLAVFAFLWKLFGIARVLAVGYVGEFSMLLLSFIAVSALRERQERESDQRMQAMQETLSGMNDPNATMPRGGDAWRAGNQAVQNAPSMIPSARRGGPSQGRRGMAPIGSPSQVQIVLHHDLGADVDSFRDRLVTRAGITSHQKKTRGKLTELTLKYDGIPDELVKMIDAGQVTEVNQKLRTIVMNLD